MPFIKLDVYEPNIIVTNRQMTIFVGLTYDLKIACAPFMSYVCENGTCEEAVSDLFPNADIIDNTPLTRMLFSTCDMGDCIPENLYIAVAELFSIYFLQREGW